MTAGESFPEGYWVLGAQAEKRISGFASPSKMALNKRERLLA
jgi:hypothetical protein